MPGHRVTVDLVNFLVDRYQSRQTYAQIAFDCGLSERVVATLVKQVIRKIDANRTERLVLPPTLGIDDIRIWRGEDGILTHLVDSDSGQTIDLVRGTRAEDVQFWLGGATDVSAVTHYSSDGAAQYIAVGRRNFPGTTRTLNLYHVVSYLLHGLDNVRRGVFGVENTDPPYPDEQGDGDEQEPEE